MIQIEITLKDKLLLQQERYTQVHPRVMQKYNVLWLKANGLSNQTICNIEGICNNTLLSIFKQYNEGGLSKLQELNFYRPQSIMSNFSDNIKEYFEKNPPVSISQAMLKIEELTGIKRGETQVRKFLKSNGFGFRRIGTVPAKALTEEKKTNREHFWSRN
jgi:transposase